MKSVYFWLICAVLAGCETGQQPPPDSASTQESQFQLTDSLTTEEKPDLATEDSVYIDFDGDGKKEYFWIEQPEVIADDMECKGECTCIIRSSNPHVEPYKLESCIDGLLVDEGDLDGDGRGDLGLLPGWFTSCWRGYYLLSWKNCSWRLLIDPMDVYVCDEYPLAQFATASKKGFIRVMVFDIINDRMGVFEEVKCKP